MIVNFKGISHIVEILLVEDRASDVELMKEALQECPSNYRLHVVHNGEDALAFLHQHEPYRGVPRPDLIMLDLNLPKLNGHEVLLAIKSHPKLKILPVLVLTTSTKEQEIVQSYELQANCCITKPIDLDQFIEVIQVTIQFWLTVVALPSTSMND